MSAAHPAVCWGSHVPAFMVESERAVHATSHPGMHSVKDNLPFEQASDPGDSQLAMHAACAVHSLCLHACAMSVQIAAQAYVFILAGFETTASALAFTAHCLATHPEVEGKLVQEVQAAFKQLAEAQGKDKNLEGDSSGSGEHI